MSVTDPIADLLTRIRNASQAKHRYLDIDWSNMAEHIADVMKQASFIEHYMVKKEGAKATLRIFLKYADGLKPVIRGLKRVSTPGRRRYVTADTIPSVFNGLGISILTTSQGVIDGNEARRRKIGGELLCYVW